MSVDPAPPPAQTGVGREGAGVGFLETMESTREFLKRKGQVSLRAPLPAALGVPQSGPERLREAGEREAEMGARFRANRAARELAW